MKIFSTEEARRVAINCAKQYRDNLLDKKLIIIYRERESNEIKFLEVLFLDRNYQHLTGLELIDDNGEVLDKQSVNFYRKCIKNKLGINEIRFKKDGTTNLKIAALPSITKIHSITKIAGDYNHKRPYLFVDKVVGGVNFCMGLIQDGDFYVPASALLEDIKNLTVTPSQVLAIMSKEKSDTTYKKIRHVANGINLNKVNFPTDILDLISLEEYIPKEKTAPLKEDKSA